MLFDPDRFVEEVVSRKRQNISNDEIQMPTYKVPPNNLQKLSLDKKIVNIVLDIKLKDPDTKKPFLLRDRFDWDLSEPDIRPVVFASELIDKIGLFSSNMTER
jgi:hypothetical protein